MKNLAILLILLIAVPCQAQILFGTMAGPPTSAPACSASTDYVGTKDTGGSPQARAKDSAWCFLFTPTCYGSLANAYVAHSGDASTARVCVYADDGDSTPDTGDAKIGCSAEITSSATEWASAAMDGGTLSSGNYWVCLFVDNDSTNTFGVDTASTTATVYYKTSTGWYDDKPSTLATMSSASGYNHNSVYVTVGE